VRHGRRYRVSLLAVSRCARLVHADQLKQLATEAGRRRGGGRSLRRAARRGGHRSRLLPSTSKQFGIVQARVEALSRLSESSSRVEAPPPGRLKWLGPLAPIGLAIWKLKLVLIAGDQQRQVPQSSA
jgi:hypothetical protein